MYINGSNQLSSYLINGVILDVLFPGERNAVNRNGINSTVSTTQMSSQQCKYLDEIKTDKFNSKD